MVRRRRTTSISRIPRAEERGRGFHKHVRVSFHQFWGKFRLMGCFSCFQPRRRKETTSSRIEDSTAAGSSHRALPSSSIEQRKKPYPNNCAQGFYFRDLAAATRNFKESNLIGEGGFGRVYKGRLDSGQVVAIKQLNREGIQGSKEFLVEVLMLIMLRHPNLVNLYGYCAEGDERLLVYEYMPQRSLEDHLFGDSTHVSTRVMGTYGYCAPDYAMSGKLTLKSDVYSFGVLLLELITGRRAFDSSKIGPEQNLITWARPFLSDRRRFYLLADPLLEGCYPPRAFHQTVVVTSMCLQEHPHVRPIIADVAVALNHVASQPYIPVADSKTCSSPSPSSYPSLNASGTPSTVRKDGKYSHKE